MFLDIISFSIVLIINFVVSNFFVRYRIPIFISSVIFIMSFGGTFYNVFDYKILLTNKKFLDVFYQMVFGLFFLEIAYDYFILKKKSLDFGFWKRFLIVFLFPIVFGFCFFYFVENKSVVTSISIGLIFTVTAVPILVRLLHNSKLSEWVRAEILLLALLIDIFSWLIFNLMNQFDWLLLLFSILIYLCLFFVFKYCNFYTSLFLFFCSFIFLNSRHLFSLFLPFIFVLYHQESLAILLGKLKRIHFFDYFCLPFIILYSTYQLSFVNFLVNLNGFYLIIVYVFLPIFIKFICSLIAFKKFEQSFKISIFLTTKGVTGIVFVNMFFSLGVLSEEEFFLLMLMNIVSTLLPLIVKK